MLLIIKALQVIAATRLDPKPWTFEGKSGTTYTAKLAVLGSAAEVASITLKAKTAEELNAKVAKFTIGKPAEIEIVEIVPIFKTGDRRPAGYEYTA